MKINIDKLTDPETALFMEMPFIDLMNLVFTSKGNLKRCPKKAKIVLVRRLENRFPMDGFGVPENGYFNDLQMYICCRLILSHKEQDLV